MSARSVIIKLYSGIRLEPALIVEPRWWNAEELCRDPRFVESNETGSYFDWEATLSIDEFKMLHERYRHAAQSGLFMLPDWQRVIGPMIQVLDAALAGGIGTITKIEVSVFEWESGLG